jgi:hypothetical protein
MLWPLIRSDHRILEMQQRFFKASSRNSLNSSFLGDTNLFFFGRRCCKEVKYRTPFIRSDFWMESGEDEQRGRSAVAKRTAELPVKLLVSTFNGRILMCDCVSKLYFIVHDQKTKNTDNTFLKLLRKEAGLTFARGRQPLCWPNKTVCYRTVGAHFSKFTGMLSKCHLL